MQLTANVTANDKDSFPMMMMVTIPKTKNNKMTAPTINCDPSQSSAMAPTPYKLHQMQSTANATDNTDNDFPREMMTMMMIAPTPLPQK